MVPPNMAHDVLEIAMAGIKDIPPRYCICVRYSVHARSYHFIAFNRGGELFFRREKY